MTVPQVVERSVRRGSGAPPRSASRAESTPSSPATSTSPWSSPSRNTCPTCTSTGSPRSRCGRAPRPSGCRCESSSPGCATPGSGPAGDGRGDPRRRRAALPLSRQDPHRQWADVMLTAHDLGCVRPRPSCSATSTRRDPGRTTSRSCEKCKREPAASPSLCRFRSSTWAARSTCGAGAGPGRPGTRSSGPRRRPDRLRWAHSQHPGVVGQARSRGRYPAAGGGLQRLRRNPDGRNDLARRRGIARHDDGTCRLRGGHPCRRAPPSPAEHTVRVCGNPTLRWPRARSAPWENERAIVVGMRDHPHRMAVDIGE